MVQKAIKSAIKPRSATHFFFSYTPATLLYIKPSFSTFDRRNNVSGCTLCVFCSHPLTRSYILAQVITLYSGTSVTASWLFLAPDSSVTFCLTLRFPLCSSVLHRSPWCSLSPHPSILVTLPPFSSPVCWIYTWQTKKSSSTTPAFVF